eukprot:scaffold32676_cov61-Phaeocystis_antarctica.AAC.3
MKPATLDLRLRFKARESSPSASNLRSTDLRRPRGLPSAAASAADSFNWLLWRSAHRPGRSLDTLSYSDHPSMWSSDPLRLSRRLLALVAGCGDSTSFSLPCVAALRSW